MRSVLQWIPPGVLAGGCLLLLAGRRQQPVDLEAPLTTLPAAIADYRARDTTMTEAERLVAGVDRYLLRIFTRDSASRFSVYVGYYQSQLQGRSIHSPKNCLPGAGWEPVDVGTATVQTPAGPVTVNRYLLEHQRARALVYYWYQGRGRIAFDEYRVKWDLLRDKALHGRSEEALVRIVVPVGAGGEASADALAGRVSAELMSGMTGLLPAL